MPITVLRPDSMYDGGGSTWFTSGGSVNAVLSDQSIGTWTRRSDSDTDTAPAAFLSNLSVPGGSTIDKIRVGVQWNGAEDYISTWGEVWLTGYTDNYYTSTVIRREFADEVIRTDYGPYRTTKLNGSAWTVADLNAALLQFSSSKYGTVNPYGRRSPFIREIFLEVTYTTHQNPSTPTSLQRTGSQTDTTPNFSAVVSDPDGNTVKATFEVYQINGTTLIGTVGSGFVSSGSTASAEYANALAVGQYKVRARTTDNEGMVSGWTSLVTFSVTTTVTKDYSFLWDVNANTSKDLVTLWDIDAGNLKDVTLQWDVLDTVIKDLILLWDSKTPWTRVFEPSSIWTRVNEL